MSRREKHPLEPFFPKDAEILILGSFPPPKARWSMEFFYPNLQNDFWRILGLVFFNDRDYFLLPEADSRDEKGVRYFDEGKIRRFLTERRIALYDAAVEVIREKGNASDSALTVVRTLDLAATLKKLPRLRGILLTGQKSMETLWPQLAPDLKKCELPRPGESRRTTLIGRELCFCRLCSPSRAYPNALEKKAEIYRRVFGDLKMT